MKKVLLATLVAVAALSSCSNEETVSVNQSSDNAIAFDIYASKAPQKRYAPGKETTSTSIQTEGFGVTAVYTSQADYGAETPNFMYNQKVVYETSAWVYSPIKYWPTTQGDKLSFFAYAPHNSNAGTGITLKGNTGDPKKIDFSCADDATQMIDFVAVASYNNVTGASPATVQFALKHELTRLAFQAKASEKLFEMGNASNQTKIIIRSAKFDKTPDFYKSATYTFADASDAHGTWDNFTADYELSITNLLNTDIVNHGNYTTTEGIALEGVDPVALFRTGDYLYLIPTNGDAGLAADDVIKVTFDYDVVTVDTSLPAGYSITSATKTVQLPAATLKQGKSYLFTFTFNVDQVLVSATVDPWGADEGNDVEVDHNNPI